MGWLKSLFPSMFLDKDGNETPTYTTGDRFNAGYGTKLPEIQRKKSKVVVKEKAVEVRESVKQVKEEPVVDFIEKIDVVNIEEVKPVEGGLVIDEFDFKDKNNIELDKDESLSSLLKRK